ncbi:hypothetical protein [Labilithrix luteola]|uniref:hypothetical protein n=1 Tax=Labilithrix luteola TaxID=1391654 RepID=UPI0011BA5515|nr:hypothetical protein [Labilithrix luteola]
MGTNSSSTDSPPTKAQRRLRQIAAEFSRQVAEAVVLAHEISLQAECASDEEATALLEGLEAEGIIDDSGIVAVVADVTN